MKINRMSVKAEKEESTANLPGDHLQDNDSLSKEVRQQKLLQVQQLKYSETETEETPLEQDDSDQDDLVDEFNQHNKNLRQQEKIQMSLVTRLLGTSGHALDLE